MKGPQRQRRPQGKLPLLNAEQRATLHGWLRETLPYSEISTRISSNFGIAVSRTALSRYFHAHYAKIFGKAAAVSPPESPLGELEITLRLSIAKDLRAEVAFISSRRIDAASPTA